MTRRGARPPGRSAVVRIAGALVALWAGTGIVGSSTTGAHADTAGYAVTARADTAGVEFVSTEAPAVSIGGGQVVFASPASAQSALQFGQSDSFASVAYPGDLVVGLPGVIAGVSGGQASPPAYPTYITSSHPVAPKAEQAAGPYSLRAQSEAEATKAVAHIGQEVVPDQVADATARTSVVRDPATGTVTGEAASETAPFTVGPLRIGRVLATAKVVAGADGVRRESDLAVGTVTVAGTEVGLTKKGLVAPGGPVPVDVSGLGAVLDAAGVAVTLVEEVETEHGIVSGGVRVTFQQNFPSLGDTIVNVLLGRVSVSANSGQGLPDPAGAPASAPLPPSDGPGAGVPVDAGPAPAALASPGAATAPNRPPAPVASGAPRPVVALPVADVWFFYPVLVVGALVALLGSRTETFLSLRSRLEAAPPAAAPGHGGDLHAA